MQPNSLLAEFKDRTDAALLARLPETDDEPGRLAEAIRYVCLNGGKRIRALLVYSSGHCLGVPAEHLDPAAAALEMIHAYSLTHDDLPAMDNDTLRRGKPTCHVAYDEATAILVGDALLSQAFSVLSENDGNKLTASQQLEMIKCLGEASGQQGMVGGQFMDLQATGADQTIGQLETLHRKKTGAIIRAAVKIGALACPAVRSDQLQKLDNYAANIGLCFQVIDDLLDEESDTETLGKTTGADRKLDKITYPTLLGLDGSRQFAEQLYNDAIAALDDFGDSAAPLRSVASIVINRSY